MYSQRSATCWQMLLYFSLEYKPGITDLYGLGGGQLQQRPGRKQIQEKCF